MRIPPTGCAVVFLEDVLSLQQAASLEWNALVLPISVGILTVAIYVMRQSH